MSEEELTNNFIKVADFNLEMLGVIKTLTNEIKDLRKEVEDLKKQIKL